MKPKIYLLLSVCLLVSPISFAQISSSLPSSVTIANASVAVQNEWSAFQNTAALASVENWEASAQYENHFMVKELSTKSMQVAKNLQSINIGASFSYFGYSLYNDMIAGVGMARNFGNKFSMGLQLDYYTSYFMGENVNRYRGTIFPQFGVSTTLFPKLTVGFNVFNPFQSNIKTEYSLKRIPSIFSLGTNYTFDENLTWLAQIDKEVSSNFRFASGFEYRMINQLAVKLGAYAQDNLVPCLGVNVYLSKIRIYLNTELHPMLGLNTQICLKYKY